LFAHISYSGGSEIYSRLSWLWSLMNIATAWIVT
jgi:hypothetical protein